MTETHFDVLAIGHALVDVTVRCDDAFLAERGIAKGAMRLVDEEEAEALRQATATPAGRGSCHEESTPAKRGSRHEESTPAGRGPRHEESTPAKRGSRDEEPAPAEASGGSAANTAVGIAALGGRACFVGMVADDALGRAFARDIRARGVAFATPAAAAGPATGRSLVLVTPDGERSMSTYLGAAAHLIGDDLDPADVAAASALYLEGYLWDAPGGPALFEAARRAARRASRDVAMTLSDPLCVERHRDAFLSFIRSGVDIVFANEEEAAALYRTGSLAATARAMAGDVRLAVLTRGEKGCLIARGSERIAIEATAAPVDVVDTTGAGDLHAAGFLYGWTQGTSLERAGRIAAICAGEVVCHTGARPQAALRTLVADKLG